MIGDDALTRFAFQQMPVRGAIVQLGATWQAVRSRNATRLDTQPLLGEACAASALMFSNIKLDGHIALQLQGGGPLRLLVAQCSSEGALRGVMKTEASLGERSLDFAELTRGATLAITIEKARPAQRYQGIVPLEGSTLARSLEGYFERSEQIPSRLWLVADGAAAAGLLLQRLPGDSDDPDGWRRATRLAETITPGELLSLPARDILHRLYHREDLLCFDPRPLHFGCPCSRERVVQVLRSLGEDELRDASRESGEVSVNCEFCNEVYRFDQVDLAELFSDLPSADGPTTPQ